MAQRPPPLGAEGGVLMAAWTEAEMRALRAAYDGAGDGPLGLDAIAKSLGRQKPNICRKARQMGLTKQMRRLVAQRKDRRLFGGDKDALRKHQSERQKRLLAEKGHPRGALGMRHTPETKARIGAKSKLAWDAMSESEKDEFVAKAYKANVEKTGGPPKVCRGSWKAGWREIGGKRNFYRSRWEANYARYLQWLKERGDIHDWVHEPETFWFDGIKRGTVSYKPDFRVWETSGRSCIHEVKGWMDTRSRTTLARMAKYHPEQNIVLIDGPQYRAIRRAVMGLVPGWEDSARDSHA
jgi:hypothetical protein